MRFAVLFAVVCVLGLSAAIPRPEESPAGSLLTPPASPASGNSTGGSPLDALSGIPGFPPIALQLLNQFLSSAGGAGNSTDPTGGLSSAIPGAEALTGN